jgi:hypothetical protein
MIRIDTQQLQLIHTCKNCGMTTQETMCLVIQIFLINRNNIAKLHHQLANRRQVFMNNQRCYLAGALQKLSELDYIVEIIQRYIFRN